MTFKFDGRGGEGYGWDSVWAFSILQFQGKLMYLVSIEVKVFLLRNEVLEKCNALGLG